MMSANLEVRGSINHMDSLLSKLGIYDILGYLIPGFLGIYSAKVLYQDIFNFKFPLNLSDGFVGSVIFLVISYFVGIILHEISQIVQERFMKPIWGGFPSERFLLIEDPLCSKKEKESYYQMAATVFNIDMSSVDKAKSQLVFDRCRTALQIAGKDERSQLFNTYYGMFRNFTTGTLVCSIVHIIFSGIYLFNLLIYSVKITNDISFFLTGVLFIVSTIILLRRTKRFGETYVKYVFRGFYDYNRQQSLDVKN